ncbi:MAG: MazG nucleotide pyrophosphohydrolase domain-containing protein [Patescibacteria group bacterium]
MAKKKTKTFQDICRLAAKLRSDTGCPWDRAQTIATMLKCIDEEAGEVCEAIENGDHENLKEELGDVLFQVVMIAQIAKENGYFDINEVIKEIDHKIRSRHTWVFGKDKVKTPEEAIAMWKRNKTARPKDGRSPNKNVSG